MLNGTSSPILFDESDADVSLVDDEGTSLLDDAGCLAPNANEEQLSAIHALLESFQDGDTQSALEAKIETFMAESFSALSADLKAEDADWIALANQGNYTQRQHSMKLSRRYVANDSNCRQIVRLYVDFAIAKGLTWRTASDADNNILTAYWEHPKNRRRLSMTGQRNSAKTCLVDGEFYFAHVLDPDVPRSRKVDALRIYDWLVDADDPDEVLGYLYQADPDNTGTFLLYLDWLNFDRRSEGVLLSTGKAPTTTNLRLVEDVVFQGIVFDEDETGRGLSIVHTSLIWARFHRHFMRIRAAVQQAIGMFARKVKSKGTQKAINNLIATYQVNTTEVHSQGYPAGSTWMENESATMTNMKQDTGAEGARVDSGMLLQMIGAGAGVFTHYLGAGESFRLATAGAMEPPMVKAFESFQQIWRDNYRYLFEWVLARSGGVMGLSLETTGERCVDVSFPQIRITDTPKMIHAIDEIMSLNPALRQSEDYHKRLLAELDFQDIPEVWRRLKPLLEEQKQIDAEQRKMVAQKDSAGAGTQGTDKARDTGSGMAEDLKTPKLNP